MASEVLKLIFRGQDDTTKAVRSLRSNLNNASKGIDSIKRSLGGMTGAIGLAAGAAGLGLLTKNALAAADELGKVSQRLGTTASSLSSLQLAASYSGIEVGTFNKLMEIFQKRLGEATQGTGQAKDALQAFGIDAQRLAALPLDEQLKVIADAFQGIQNPAERAAAASDLFSNRGIKMLNFLDLGSQGIDELRHEFRRLGLEISDRSIDDIESFNDAMTKVGAIVNTAMIQSLAKAAPEMEKFADRAAEMAVPLVGKLFDGLNWILDNVGLITSGIKLLVGAMIATRVITFAAGIAQLATALVALAPAATAASAAFLGPAGLVAAVGAGAFAVGSFIDEKTGVSSTLADFVADLTGVNDAFDDLTKATDLSKIETKDNAKVMKGATKETDDLEEAVDALQDVVKDTAKKPLPDFADEVENIADEEVDATLETDDFREAIEKLQKAARTGEDEIADFERTLEDYRRTVQATDATQDDFRDALRNSIKDLTGVKFEAQDLREEIAAVNAALEIATEEFGANSEEVQALEARLEALGGELVETIRATGTLTESQRELLNEVTENERAMQALEQTLADLTELKRVGAITAEQYAGKTAEVRQEINDLKGEMDGLAPTVEGAFDIGPVEDFFREVAGGASAGGALPGMIGALIGSGGVQDAITGCFGTGPVDSFDAAVRRLFGGSGSALGGFQGALGSLTGALEGFFAGGELKFSAFKDAILRTLSEIAAAAVASVGINFLKNLIPGLNTGGAVDGFAGGGRVSGMGGPKEDKVLARLSPGEYVINAASVSKFGQGFFDAVNSGKLPGFQVGGLVADSALQPFGAAIPGFNVVFGLVGLINSIIELLAGGTSRAQFGEANNRLEAAKNDWISQNVTGAFDGLNSTFPGALMDYFMTEIGIGSDGLPIVDGLPGVVSPSPFGRLISTIANGTRFPGGDNEAGYRQNKTIAEGMGNLSDELGRFLYEYMGSRMLSIRSPAFNMDDVVARLFNSAQGVAGGSLTLAARQFGGPLERGQPALVGEGGPELFVPGRGGTVSPIARDGAEALVTAVHEVRDEISDLRRQFSRALSGGALAGGRG